MQAIDDFANFFGLLALIVVVYAVLSWLSPYLDMLHDAFMYVWGGVVTPTIEFTIAAFETVKEWLS